jgi:hypothetical protein
MFLFISHSGPDTWVARQLSDQCRALGAVTFLDEAEIAIGAKFETDILAALRKSDELVVLLTPWALDRPYVWMEIGAAWYKDIPIIAVLLGITPKEIQEHPRATIAIKERNIIHLNDIDRYFEQLEQRIVSSRKAVATP